jgi:NAD(P)-dependent dehydrogenase (short-subunit alcohol dehydrogenase family)
VEDIPRVGSKAAAIQDAVAKTVDVGRALSQAAHQLDPIVIPVNNAGVYALSRMESLSEEEFHRHFNFNVLGRLNAGEDQPYGGGNPPIRHRGARYARGVQRRSPSPLWCGSGSGRCEPSRSSWSSLLRKEHGDELQCKTDRF